MNVQMNKLAGYFDKKGTLPKADDPEFKRFLDTYGHRGTIELDFGTPRWKEDPRYLISQIGLYMKDKAYERNLRSHMENAQKAKKMIQDIYTDTIQLKGKRYATRLKNSLEKYRIAAGMREYPKFNILQGLDLGRDVMLSAGKELTDVGLISCPDDIFYMHKAWIISHLEHYENASDEGKTAIQLAFRSEVDKNRIRYQREVERKSIPRIILSSGETYYTGGSDINRDGLIKGYPLSSGSYTGKIKVVHNPETAQLEEGDILVAESTNPAWTPLFMTAGGLIMEYGGPLSHGGIVAREYGIPAVVGISCEAEGLKDGQTVKIDGFNGTVEILKDE
jgi:pyruvate,water dikinase